MNPPDEHTARIIEQAKHQLQRMIDTNPDIMLLIDEDGTVLRTNKALLDALNLDGYAEAVGQSACRLLACREESLLTRIMQESAETRILETTAGMADGGEHVLRVTVIPSGPGLWVLVVRDVTEEKSEAVRLEKSHKKEAVQALAGALMHHANQALTVIMVSANLLQIELEKGNVDVERFQKAMGTIVSNATRVSELLQRAENPTDYVTETYLEGLDILDLNRSGGEKA